MDDETAEKNSQGPVILGTADGQGILGATSTPALSRRHLLMGAAMLSVGGLSFARMPTRKYDKLGNDQFEALIPKSFGKWRTLPTSELIMPPESDLADQLYEHILTRTYVGPGGEAVMLLIAYNSAQVNNVQIHRPEICYSASGFAIKSSTPFALNLMNNRTISARAVSTERSARRENIIYWTRIGDAFPQTWVNQRIAMTMSNIEGYYADGLLLRASNVENDVEQSFENVSGFLRDLERYCGPRARHFVFRS